MPRVLHIETLTHGRVLVEEADEDAALSAGVIVGCHGYGQRAEDVLEQMNRIPSAVSWTRVAVQALHRFYTRGDQKVVASWMTREDRDLAITDNIAYLDRVLDAVLPRRFQPAELRTSTAPELPSSKPPQLALFGFSQGAAMVYRAALLGRHAADVVIALGGDIPPELRNQPTPRPWPRVLIGAGDSDPWYDEEAVTKDEAFLRLQGIAHTIVRYEGGHEWTDAFGTAVSRVISR